MMSSPHSSCREDQPHGADTCGPPWWRAPVSEAAPPPWLPKTDRLPPCSAIYRSICYMGHSTAKHGSAYTRTWQGFLQARFLGGRLPPQKLLLSLFVFTLSPLPLSYPPPPKSPSTPHQKVKSCRKPCMGHPIAVPGSANACMGRLQQYIGQHKALKICRPMTETRDFLFRLPQNPWNCKFHRHVLVSMGTSLS